MSRKYINTIKSLGLTENEASVYYASLTIGPSSMTELSKEANLKRPNTYQIVSSLEKKGLMSTELDGFHKKYVAEDPNGLKSILDKKTQALDEMLPALSDLYKEKGRVGEIKYYEGLEGIKTMYSSIIEVLTEKDYYLVVSNAALWYQNDEKFFRDYVKKRVKKNIHMRMLTQDSEEARYQRRFARNFLQQVKILPEDTSLSTDSVITPHYVTLVQTKAPIWALLIQTPSIIEMQKQYFEIMWNSTPD